jgi:hypothetical protein
LPDGQRIVAAIACAADVMEGSLACESARPPAARFGPQFLIVGGQGEFVLLSSSGVAYQDNKQIFKADVNVKNLILQPLGTPDGTTATGVNVFFHLPAYVTSGDGTITLTNPTGTGDFTETGQEYFGYNDILGYGMTSSDKKWEWSVPTTVNTFAFQVYVAADVPYPDGWVDVTPAAATIAVDGTQSLSAVVRDVVGTDTGGSVTWSSSDELIATVGMDGTVTGVGPGVATITASSGGPEADGTAAITVSG